MTLKEEQKHMDLLPCPFCGRAPRKATWKMHPSACCDNENCCMYQHAVGRDKWNIRDDSEVYNLMNVLLAIKDVGLSDMGPHDRYMEVREMLDDVFLKSDTRKADCHEEVVGEVDKLRKVLRERCLVYQAMTMYCDLCNTRTPSGKPEMHADGCLCIARATNHQEG